MPVRRASDRAEVHPPVLIRPCGGTGLPRYQADALAALDLHAQLQSFQPVQKAIDALRLPISQPSRLSATSHAQVPESWTVHRDLPDACRRSAHSDRVPSLFAYQTDGCSSASRHDLRTFTLKRFASRPPAHAAGQPSKLFRTTSCRICLSNVRLATMRLSLVFSSSSIFRRLSSLTPRSPNFFFHV